MGNVSNYSTIGNVVGLIRITWVRLGRIGPHASRIWKGHREAVQCSIGIARESSKDLRRPLLGAPSLSQQCLADSDFRVLLALDQANRHGPRSRLRLC